MKLCNLETSKALQELGYDGEYTHCHVSVYVYPRNEYQIMTLSRCEKYRHDISILCPAPRLDDATYWLREKFKLNIRINYITLNECWFYDILNIETGEYYDGGDWIYEIYDTALEAAVKRAIELIKKRKQ